MGLASFTGCSYAGVINVYLHAQELAQDTPIYCVVSRYHLTDASDKRLDSNLEDLERLKLVLGMPGHCQDGGSRL